MEQCPENTLALSLVLLFGRQSLQLYGRSRIRGDTRPSHTGKSGATKLSLYNDLLAPNHNRSPAPTARMDDVHRLYIREYAEVGGRIR
jgi:hypothetical protein